MKVETEIAYFNRAKKVRDLWSQIWHAAYNCTFPNKDIYMQMVAGTQKNGKSGDMTGQIAANRFVAMVQNGLTPLFSNWSILKPGNRIPEAQKSQVTRYLQGITDQIFEYLHASNFNTVITEAYQDLVIGTGAFLCLEGNDDKPFIFRAIPLQNLILDESESPDIHNVWREYNDVPVNDIQLIWKNAKLTADIKMMMTDGANPKINLIEGTTYDLDKDMYTYRVISLHNNEVLLEIKERSSPWIIFRWSRINGEAYGRGVGIYALPAMLVLNEMVEYDLASASINAFPIYMAYSDGVFNPHTTKIRPRTIIEISRIQGNVPPIMPLPQAGNVQYAQIKIEDLRDQVNKIFFTDPLGQVTDEKMTATEANIRKEESLQERAPSIARLQVELGQKLMTRMLFILKKRGLIEDITVNNREVKIEYLSELVTLEGLKKTNSVAQMAQILQSIVGSQITIGAYKLPKLPEFIANNLNVPMDIVNDEAEISEAAKQQQQQAEQQQVQLPTPPQGGQQNQIRGIPG